MDEKFTRLTDRKREAIVRAAIGLFQKNGVEGTSMDKVSEVAQVSKRTVYNHFPSKEELFAECCRVAWPGGGTPLPSYVPGQPLREQLTAFVEQKIKQLSDDQVTGLARVALMSMLGSSEWAQDLHERLGNLDTETVKWVHAAHAQGALDECDPDTAALLLDALITGTAFWPQVSMRRWKLTVDEQRQIANEIIELFMCRYAPAKVADAKGGKSRRLQRSIK